MSEPVEYREKNGSGIFQQPDDEQTASPMSYFNHRILLMENGESSSNSSLETYEQTTPTLDSHLNVPTPTLLDNESSESGNSSHMIEIAFKSEENGSGISPQSGDQQTAPPISYFNNQMLLMEHDESISNSSSEITEQTTPTYDYYLNLPASTLLYNDICESDNSSRMIEEENGSGECEETAPTVSDFGLRMSMMENEKSSSNVLPETNEQITPTHDSHPNVPEPNMLSNESDEGDDSYYIIEQVIESEESNQSGPLLSIFEVTEFLMQNGARVLNYSSETNELSFPIINSSVDLSGPTMAEIEGYESDNSSSEMYQQTSLLIKKEIESEESEQPNFEQSPHVPVLSDLDLRMLSMQNEATSSNSLSETKGNDSRPECMCSQTFCTISAADYEKYKDIDFESSSSFKSYGSLTSNERCLSRDAFPFLNMPWPLYAYLTPGAGDADARLFVRMHGIEVLDNISYPSSSRSLSPVIPEMSELDFDSSISTAILSESDMKIFSTVIHEVELTDAFIQETKEAFRETGSVEHILRWPLSTIESEIAHFKEEADIARATLLNERKKLDSELRFLKEQAELIVKESAESDKRLTSKYELLKKDEVQLTKEMYYMSVRIKEEV